MAEPQAQILPTYVIIDESKSMEGTEQDLQAGLETLLDALQENADASAVAHVGVVGFSDAAFVRQPLTDWAELAEVPELQLGVRTSYQAAFELLRDTIEDDVEALKASNYRVLRPAVFFLSDGKPNLGSWENAHEALVSSDFKYRPNVLAFGIGEAEPEIIAQVATHEDYAFMVEAGILPGDALLKFFTALTRSVIASGAGVATGGERAALQVAQPEGFINIEVDGV